MRRFIAAVVVTIAASSAASGQNQQAQLQGSATLLANPFINQPSSFRSRYVSLNRAAGSQSTEEFPAPAIPVVLSAREQDAVNPDGYNQTIPPCAGEPFFVYRPPVRVPYWLLGEMIGPGAGLWPAGRAAGVISAYGPPSYRWGGGGYWSSSYSVHSYYGYRSGPIWPGYATRPPLYHSSGWYPPTDWYAARGWYGSSSWYGSWAWGGYSEWTSQYRVNSFWPGYSWRGLTFYRSTTFWSGYRPWYWYRGYPRAYVQFEPEQGSWQPPDKTCYTRDPQGRVVLMK